MKIVFLVVAVFVFGVVALPSKPKYTDANGPKENAPKHNEKETRIQPPNTNVTNGDTPAASDRLMTTPTATVLPTPSERSDNGRRNARNFMIEVGTPGLGFGFPFLGGPIAGPFFGGPVPFGPGPVAPGFFNNPLRFWL